MRETKILIIKVILFKLKMKNYKQIHQLKWKINLNKDSNKFNIKTLENGNNISKFLKALIIISKEVEEYFIFMICTTNIFILSQIIQIFLKMESDIVLLIWVFQKGILKKGYWGLPVEVLIYMRNSVKYHSKLLR